MALLLQYSNMMDVYSLKNVRNVLMFLSLCMKDAFPKQANSEVDDVLYMKKVVF